jgi:cytochrome P450
MSGESHFLLYHLNLTLSRCVLRDPKLFGEDADAYNPGRFLPEFNPRANELPDVSSIPFGFGKRFNCSTNSS